MKLLTSSSIAALATLFSISAAPASDLLDSLNDPAPTQAQVNWSGLWVGAVGGYQFTNTGFDYDSIQNFPTGHKFNNSDHNHSDGVDVRGLAADGFLGELQLGYDHQVNSSLVVGAFGGFNLTNADPAQFNVHLDKGFFAGETSVAVEQEWGGVLGARVGLLKNPNTMFYVAGGWAFGELGKMIASDGTDSAEIYADQDHDLNGWFAQVGMETKVSGNIYLTVDGRYTDFNSLNFSDAGDCPQNCGEDDATYAETLEVDHGAIAVMVGLKAKLGGF